MSAVHADVLDPATDRPKGVKLDGERQADRGVRRGASTRPALLLRSGLDAGGPRRPAHLAAPGGGDARRLRAAGRRPSPARRSASTRTSSSSAARARSASSSRCRRCTRCWAPPSRAASARKFAGPVRRSSPGCRPCLGITVDGLLPEEEGAHGAAARGRLLAATPSTTASCPRSGRRSAWPARRWRRFSSPRGRSGSARCTSTRWCSTRRPRSTSSTPPPWEKLRVKVVTAHQMGGCAMGKDASTSVVDPHAALPRPRQPLRGRRLGVPHLAGRQPAADHHRHLALGRAAHRRRGGLNQLPGASPSGFFATASSLPGARWMSEAGYLAAASR